MRRSELEGPMDNLSLEPKMAGREMYKATDARPVVIDREAAMPTMRATTANLEPTMMMAATETKTMRHFRSEMS